MKSVGSYLQGQILLCFRKECKAVFTWAICIVVVVTANKLSRLKTCICTQSKITDNLTFDLTTAHAKNI